MPKTLPTLLGQQSSNSMTFPSVSPIISSPLAEDFPQCSVRRFFEAYLSLPRVETDLVENIPDEDVEGGRVSQELNLLTL